MSDTRERAAAPASSEAAATKGSWTAPDEPPYIRVESVTKRFGDFVAVDDVSLDIYRGELFSLLGASGCGKTTLLRMLAGLEQPSAGRILIDGQDMTDVPPYERPVNMMFQSYALFPHMSVAQNVAFGLRQEKMSRAEADQRVAEMLDLVQLERFARRKPHQLSGGQRQRVALARSLAKHPKLLLLDEPLAALDKKLREQTQFELMNIQDKTGVTFIVVTHDQEEAMTLSTRIAVMDEGRIQQLGTPREIYEFPKTRFVADFVGSINMFEGRLDLSGGAEAPVLVDSASGQRFAVAPQPDLVDGATATLALRPEKIAIAKTAPEGADNVCHGTVDDFAYQGSLSIYRVALADGTIVRVTAPNLTRMAARPIEWDEEVWLSWSRDAGVVLTE